MSLTNFDLDVDEVVRAVNEKAFEDLPHRIAELESELRIAKEDNEALRSRLDLSDMDSYQDFATGTAVFGKVDHPSAHYFLDCFAAMGVVAERAKKAFRDHGGEFTEESRASVWGAFERIAGQVPQAVLAMSKPSGPHGSDMLYPAFGLVGEAGEVVGKLAPFLGRESEMTEEDRIAIAAEIGDVLWYVAALCTWLGLRMSRVAGLNRGKLTSRRVRKVVHGEGDNR